MGHACQILTFKETTSKRTIAAECTEWGDYNCDPYEHGGHCDCGGIEPYYTNRLFDSYEEAVEYLDKTFGNYRQTAVRYKKYPTTKPTKAMEDLKRRISEYEARIAELNKPHYAFVKVKTVKCKCCGAVLPTAYCGKSYHNNCPVCKSDLRPETSLSKIDNYKATIKELTAKLKAEQKKLDAKNEKKATIYWAVACEVHC